MAAPKDPCYESVGTPCAEILTLCMWHCHMHDILRGLHAVLGSSLQNLLLNYTIFQSFNN